VLERLSPDERAAFLPREVFDKRRRQQPRTVDHPVTRTRFASSM